MSLRSRLFAFFMAIVVVPLALASGIGRRLIVGELERRTSAQLTPAGGAASAVYQQRAANALDRVQLIASEEAFQRSLLDKNFAQLQGYIAPRVGEDQGLDYIVVSAPDGSVLAEAFSTPNFLDRVEVPTASDVISTGSAGSFLVTRSFVPIKTSGEEVIANVHGGYFLDNGFVQALSDPTGVDVTIFVSERAISSTLAPAKNSSRSVVTLLSSAGEEDGPFLKTEIADEPVYAATAPLATDIPITKFALVVSTSQEQVAAVVQTMTISMLVLLILATILAAFVGYVLSHRMTRPLRDLSAGANAIAAGNYDQHIDVKSKDEVGKLAGAFNEMAVRLADHIAELKESREDLKRALTRFGQTLRSTHDLDQLLNDVVETSVEYLHAGKGILFLLNPARDRLRVRVARGFDIPDFELKLGEGLAGFVAESGSPIRVPDGAVVAPSPLEPKFRTALVVPVFSQERIAGVLCLYDKEEEQNFTESDMTSLLSLADSAGVAIENVLLHDEARRLSIVDTVVGTWNRRYFMLRFEQELERSARFRRPFSLLLIDIDDFKVVNDTHGHQRGDSVLVEVARRVNDAIREIDVFARFGGEEFVLILPETDAEGGVATAEKIRSLISDKPFEGNPPLTVTVSVGVSCYWEHGRDQESLIRAADLAMYEAKRITGKNRVVLYTPPDEPQRQEASG